MLSPMEFKMTSQQDTSGPLLKVLGISGSLRKGSFNSGLLRVAPGLLAKGT